MIKRPIALCTNPSNSSNLIYTLVLCLSEREYLERNKERARPDSEVSSILLACCFIQRVCCVAKLCCGRQQTKPNHPYKRRIERRTTTLDSHRSTCLRAAAVVSWEDDGQISVSWPFLPSINSTRWIIRSLTYTDPSA